MHLPKPVKLADYQSIGVRCREALLAFANAAQTVIPWAGKDEPPKKADLKAWTDYICGVALAGAAHEDRRHLFKTLLESAWKFTNWLDAREIFKMARCRSRHSSQRECDQPVHLCRHSAYPWSA